MHVPDGFLDLPTSLATGAVALGAVGVALRRSEGDRMGGPALAGLSAAFIFAAQMVNFPVGAGTSGHLIGATLAAVLLGPSTGLVVMSVVLVVQALLFADGGLSALGTNIILLGVVPVLVGYGLTRAFLLVTRRWRPTASVVVPAAALAAFVTVPTAALAFVALYAIGGSVPIPLPALATAMVGWHLLIGIGEAVITATVLGAVVAVRPDLVAAVRDRRPSLPTSAPPVSDPAQPAGSGASTGHRSSAPATDGGASTSRLLPARGRGLAGLALSVTLLVAGGLALVASASPDGLEYVAGSLGFESAGRDSAASVSPLADYALPALGPWGTALAGVIGVLVTLLLAVALQRRSRGTSAAAR